jgi:hypothetical protein
MRTPRWVEGLGVAALIVGAVAVWALAWNYPHFDTYVHLVWGRELIEGHAPAYQDYVAPTPHPLWLGVCAVVAAIFGGAADHAIMLVALLSWAAMLLAIYRLGAAAMNPAVGALAAVLVGTSATIFFFATSAYVDIPFLALVLWAAALEAARPRRGVPVMMLLALAGLLRPEAWLLGGAYLLWVALGDRRVRTLAPLAGLAAAAPLIWAGIDLAVTGDPLYSLNRTQAGAIALNRVRGVEEVPGSLATFLGSILREPVAVLGALGLLASVALLGVRRLMVPLAILTFGIAGFFAIGVAGLSILPRYVILPATALALFAAFALLGWTTLHEETPARRAWRVAGIASLCAGAVAVAVFGLNTVQFTDAWRDQRATHDELERILAEPAVRACGLPVTLPGFRLVPDVRWILDADERAVGARANRRPARGVELVIRDPNSAQRFIWADGLPNHVNRPDEGFRQLAESGRFVAYGKCD